MNGSPYDDFVTAKGLRQGDPFPHFLFSLVAEGLAKMLAKASEVGAYSSFRIGESWAADLLQFADDTVIIGEDSWNNLWCTKTVLRVFDLASGLQVNLAESCSLGVHVEDSFMQATSTFLCCRIGKFPFNFLGIPIGSNHRKLFVWNPVIEKMRNILSSWKSRLLSIGGRITLINYVLNEIPIYFLSFFKISKVVLKEMIKLQR
ncbi:uncharacterized protein LOC131649404 [Vicia villosa]|uniref:uncharacterized protein LOC131649404 n=1 Tax=Vicia villosa TaxID=3911 RepID=UPI00273BC8E6|nr:uncharacterized protein LOC131649404 [Vicia villosa]